ncbi:MAG: NADH-quinone oxidoreductase subunit NuoG [Thermodesulfobacteriota bacterium]
MATIYIDHTPYQVADDQNLLTACLSLGFDVPYFCWHPALHSVGSCRLCAVKNFRDEDDTRGHIVMSCMTPVKDGMRISLDDPEVREFRKSVIEWLMLNHPHDCPVCDEGGECHLQDMTVMTGHNYRRFPFKKRTFRNQYLGPFLHHEMNRCIQCYRCVRFYRHYAGGRDLNVFGTHARLYFGRAEDGVLENEFSGNLVEVCPTGVFTDRTLRRHFTRKWDLQTAPSVCVHCGVGCNTIPGERYGTLRRVLNRYHSEVNGYFLCDRGRFGYEFVNHPGRIRRPLVGGRPVSAAEALAVCGSALTRANGVVGIGSPRASLESNFALRALVGAERFSMGVSGSTSELMTAVLDVLRNSPVPTPSLREMEQADAVLVLGEDVLNTAPRLALTLRRSALNRPLRTVDAVEIPRWSASAVRQVIQDEKGPLFLATPCGTRLDDVATRTYHGTPDEIARLGFAVAHELDSQAPPVTNLSTDAAVLAGEIAEELREAERPLVVSGMSLGSLSVVQAASNVARALHKLGRGLGPAMVVPECNSLGVSMIGGLSLEDAADLLRSGKADTLIVLENDLFRRAPRAFVEELFARAAQVIVIDHIQTRSTGTTFPSTQPQPNNRTGFGEPSPKTLGPAATNGSRHDPKVFGDGGPGEGTFFKKPLPSEIPVPTGSVHVVLPAATFAESTGTLVSSEGRAQRFYRVFPPSEDVLDGWKWVRELASALGRPEARSWGKVDDVLQALSRAVPACARLSDAFPNAEFRVLGQRVPRQPPRYSGRTAIHAQVSVHEQAPPSDADSPLAFSMEGFGGQPPSGLTARFWTPGWNSVQALNKFQSEISGPLRGGDSGVRLLEGSKEGGIPYFSETPSGLRLQDGELQIVPLCHVFGSEELSALSPAIEELAPKPYVALGSATAERLRLNEGDVATLALGDEEHTLPVRVVPTLPEGVLGLPVGLLGPEGSELGVHSCGSLKTLAFGAGSGPDADPSRRDEDAHD